MTDVVQMRKAEPGDVPFITNSWLKSYRSGGIGNRLVPNDVYYQMHHAILEVILPKGLAVVLCNPEDRDMICGWAHAETFNDGLVLHYAYVKNSLRRHGLFTKLMDTLIEHERPQSIMYTHKTEAFDKVTPKHKGWIYNPYRLYESWREE